MKVRHTNPSSPKHGTIEHLQPHVAQMLAAAGLCEIIPYKDFRERLSCEAASASGAGCVNPNVVGVEWGIKPSAACEHSTNLVVKKSGCETTYYTAPPDDAPQSIKRRFAEIADAAPRDPFELDKAKYAAQEQRERERTAKLPWERV